MKYKNFLFFIFIFINISFGCIAFNFIGNSVVQVLAGAANGGGLRLPQRMPLISPFYYI